MVQTLSLSEAAKALNDAQSVFDTAWAEYFDEQVELLPLDRFYEIQKEFVKHVITFCIKLKRTNGMEDAARELFRVPFTEDPSCKYTFDEAVRFARTWGECRHYFEGELSELFPFVGDSFSDFMDTLPLLNRSFYDAAPSFKSQKSLTQATQQPEYGPAEIATLIGKELYIRSFLEAQAKYYYLAQRH